MRSIVTRLPGCSPWPPKQLHPASGLSRMRGWFAIPRRRSWSTRASASTFRRPTSKRCASPARRSPTPSPDLGVATNEIDLIINCHLHADHAGGNIHFRGPPPRPAGRARRGTRRRITRCPRTSTSTVAFRMQREGEHEPAARHPHHSDSRALAGTRGGGPIESDAGRLLLAGHDLSAGFRLCTSRHCAAVGPRGLRRPTVLSRVAAAPARLQPYRVAFGHDHAVWQPDA